MGAKYLDNNGLLYVWKKLKETFVKKTELEAIKAAIPKNVADLSDGESYALSSSIPTKVENLTDASDYAKKTEIPHSVDSLEGISAYAKITAIPKKVAELEDARDYVKMSELTEKIYKFVGDIKSVEFSIVETLPTSGEDSVIYLVYNPKAEKDSYDEFIWIDDAFEKIGTTAIDLSGYVKSEDIIPITNAEIDGLFV